MTALVGTVTKAATSGTRGVQNTGVLKYTLLGALVNGDTITWSNAIPSKAQAKVIAVEFVAPELDTNATPTATATIGDGTDADGYLTTFNLGLPAQLPANGAQLLALGNGAIIGTATQAGRDVVFTVTAAVATGATSGDIWVFITVEGI